LKRALRSWSLFGLLAIVVSAANCVGLAFSDLNSRRGAESVVLYSVRCALPLFFLAFTASSLATLWPGPPTRWLLANRRYIGLAFAFAMAWHLTFVAHFLVAFRPHLSARVIEADVVGFVFLVAMTLTSFRPVARHLSVGNWRRLHKTGIYAIWLLLLYIYQGSARSERDLYHFAVLGVLVGAWLLRVIAWTQQSTSTPQRVGTDSVR
jgi:methionine sulfoxide reductase heme-binding subunit